MDQNKELLLLREMIQTISLSHILDLTGKLLEKIEGIDGYAFFILDETKEKLIIEKVKFNGKFQEMEKILFKTSYALNSSSLYQNLMKENKYILIDQDNIQAHSTEVKRTFDLWEAKGLAYISLLPPCKEIQFDNSIGVLMLLSQSRPFSNEMILEAEDNVSIFYYAMKNSKDFFHLKEKELEIKKGFSRNYQILELADKLNNLSSLDSIYLTILEKIEEIFHFDLGMIFLEKNNLLEFINIHIVSQKFNLQKIALLSLMKKVKGYSINPPDGAPSVSHSRNTFFYFADVQPILNLPMSPLDKQVLTCLDSPKTFLLMPIRRNGKSIGIIQLYTLENNINLSESDIKVIESLFSLLGTALANAEVYTIVENQKKKLEEKNNIIQLKNRQLIDELKLAQKIQQNIIPIKAPDIEGLKIASLYKPMENVGGDFFDFIHIQSPNLLGVFISDVSGHGVPAALITSMVKTLLETAGDKKFSPTQLLDYMNDKITGQTSGNFLTAFYGILDIKTKVFKYSRASHPYPFLIRNQKITELISRGKMLGVSQGVYFEEKEIQLKSGDKIIFFTDGLTEAVNHENIEFETKLEKILIENNSKPVDEFVQIIYHELIKHREEYNFDDDVCIVCMEIN